MNAEQERQAWLRTQDAQQAARRQYRRRRRELWRDRTLPVVLVALAVRLLDRELGEG